MLEFYRKLAAAYGALGFPAKAGAVVLLVALTMAVGTAVVVFLPSDYFSRAPSQPAWWRRHPVLHVAGLIVKNALGLLFLPVGIVMALPLVPGPGLVFILIGFSLLDFPGKRSLERKLLGIPSVLRFFNDVRARWGRPPFSRASSAP